MAKAPPSTMKIPPAMMSLSARRTWGTDLTPSSVDRWDGADAAPSANVARLAGRHPGVLDDRPPQLDLGLELLAVRLGCRPVLRDRRCPDLTKPRDDLLVRERRNQRRVELVDDLLRC